SVAELEALEAREFLLDELLVGTGLPAVGPVPRLDQQLAGGAVGLEVEQGDDLVADQDGQGEVAELSLRLCHIGLEDVLVAEKQLQAGALDNERIERAEDMDDWIERLAF